MARRKIGVIVDSFRLTVEEGIRKAAQLGADGFQIYVTRGKMQPEEMDAAARRDFKQFVADQGLVISALCADYGKGFLDPELNRIYVPKSKKCVDLAVDLETRVITTHIGTLPEDENDPRWKTCYAAVCELADYAEAQGVFFATETGPESGEHLKRFLDSVPSAGIRVNYDPANLVRKGFDHIAGVAALKDYIVHTHAKDGSRALGKEVALGQGDVDFPRYIAALDAIGYKGFLTVEREVGDDPVGDIAQAVRYLRTL